MVGTVQPHVELYTVLKPSVKKCLFLLLELRPLDKFVL